MQGEGELGGAGGQGTGEREQSQNRLKHEDNHAVAKEADRRAGGGGLCLLPNREMDLRI